RLAPSPVAHGGKQKADDHRRDIAEDHVVAVPGHAVKVAAWPRSAQRQMGPEQHGQTSIKRGQQVKRAKADGEQNAKHRCHPYYLKMLFLSTFTLPRIAAPPRG